MKLALAVRENGDVADGTLDHTGEPWPRGTAVVGGGESGGAVKELPPAPGGSSVAMGKATVRNGSVSAGSETWASQMAVWGASRADGVVTKVERAPLNAVFLAWCWAKEMRKLAPGVDD